MLVRHHQLLIILSLILFATSASAQTKAAPQVSQTSTPVVTAAASAEGIRFVSPASVSQMRLEIYTANGELVFDSGARQGSILNWKKTDVSQPLADGSYLSVVTVKDFQGKLRQRTAVISSQSGQVTISRLRQEELTAAQSQTLSASRQAQKIETTESNESLTVISEGKERSITVTAHDGQDGQVTSTSGALTLRTGDVFSGTDKEQVRITPEGRVGIGTDSPEATLDVAGTVRARGGIVFEDGTVLTSAASVGNQKSLAMSRLDVTSNTSNLAPAGSGTTNRLTKWTDGANSVMGDSVITESSGNIGIGTSSPINALEVRKDQAFNGNLSSMTQLVVRNDNPTGFSAISIWGVGAERGRYQFNGASPNIFLSSVGKIPFHFGTDDTVRMSIDGTTGNVGVGMAPGANKLSVSGNIKLSGATSGIVFQDGSVLTTASAGGGGTPTGNSIVTAINDVATTTAINDNKLSSNVARLGGANIWAGANVFSAGLSAGGGAIINVANPTAATDAANKGYVDSNFLKFTPAAQQVSVGDANGTAAMLNLRGGSTCCSGPGGFTPADFKVFQNGSFLATGNLGIGTIPMEGKGYRTMWYTYKGAFRSGYADNEWDDANTGFFSWAGGSNSTASGLYSLSFGDTNFASSTSSIAFGSGNEVKGAAGFSAGAGNRVCDTYGVAFGNKAQSGGPLINGKCDPDTFNLKGLAAIALGFNVTADADHSTAMGKFASNNGFSGTFVWSDGSATASADTFRNTANNEFAARATGGFRFRTNLTGTTGCNLPAGSGVFTCTSSRWTKENVSLTNGEDVLSRLRKIPVSTWNYISEGRQVRHMGPMAEDFYQSFGLGTGNTSIGVQDLAGVSLAAVKALELRTSQLQQKSVEVEQLRTELNELRDANAAMQQRLAALEQSIKANAGGQQHTQKQAQR